MFKLYMGFGCRLYLAGSPRCPANMYNSGRKGMTQSLRSSGFPRNRLCISALAPSVAGSLEAYKPAPAVGPAHCSVRNRAASPSCMDTQGWVRGPTRTYQVVIARWVEGLTRTCQRYRPRWYQSRAWGYVVQLIPCVSAACYTLRHHRGPPQA